MNQKPHRIHQKPYRNRRHRESGFFRTRDLRWPITPARVLTQKNPTWCQSAAAYCALSVLVSLLNVHVVTFLPSVTLLLAVQAASTCLALALASRVPPREVCVGAVRAFPATFV